MCGSGAIHLGEDPNPGLKKMIILDEADMMTKQAQLALRRVMEDYSGSAR